MADKILINLATGLEDAERVLVAFLIGGAALEAGRPTAMFLTKDAVRLAVRYDYLQSIRRDLLRNGTTLPRLRRTWKQLPEAQLPERFRKHAQWAYDMFYKGVRDGVVAHRLKPGGVVVYRGDPAVSTRIPDSDYIPELVRAVRNPAHGLIAQLTAPEQERERRVITTHSGPLLLSLVCTGRRAAFLPTT